MNGWRAWYYDGTTIDSKNSSVDDLPEFGLQIIVEYLDPPFRNIYHGEFLYWDGVKWYTAVTREEIPIGAKIFPGLLIPDPEFEWLQREAFAEESL